MSVEKEGLALATGMGQVVAAATVTVQVAVLFPSTVVTVMVAVPTAPGVTTPLATVATTGLLVDQLTAVLVALAGATVAVRVVVEEPAVRVRVE
jgi:hypothetical protein